MLCHLVAEYINISYSFVQIILYNLGDVLACGTIGLPSTEQIVLCVTVSMKWNETQQQLFDSIFYIFQAYIKITHINV